MTTSAKLGITHFVAGQGSGEVTINEFINRVDAMSHLAVEDRDLSSPPGSPTAGDVYLVNPTGGGDWVNHDDELAIYVSGWTFVAPVEGMRLWLKDENVFLLYDGTTWITPLVETEDAITASVTQTQGQGSLTAAFNRVTTVVNPNDTVTLPTAVAGKSIVIVNRGGNVLRIYPALGDQIYELGVDILTTLADNARLELVAMDDTDWE